MIRRLVFLATIAASLAALTGRPLEAAIPAGLVSPVTVRYGAIELRSAEGIARLYGRLRQAARGSCESLPGLDRWTATARQRCQRDTLEAAIRQVRHAWLTAHHRACQRDPSVPRCGRP